MRTNDFLILLICVMLMLGLGLAIVVPVKIDGVEKMFENIDIVSWIGWLMAIIIPLWIISMGIRIIRPTERGLVERFGKYHHFANPGFHLIIPVVDKMYKINITEMMVNAEPQTIITKDKLNAQVDAQVYFKIKDNENDVKSSQYNVFDYKNQIVNLARTTLRNIIGTLMLTEANSDRNRINNELMATLAKETANWGIEVVRTELKEIDPPKDVQDTMNLVVKAENTKQANIDFATAAETEADGKRRAAIKNAEGIRQATILEAEGDKQSRILRAEGQAKAFELINKSFIDNAQVLKKLETIQASLENNTKYVIDPNSNITNIITEKMAGIIPAPTKKETLVSNTIVDDYLNQTISTKEPNTRRRKDRNE